MPKGIVKRWLDSYGFIVPDEGGKDVFVHLSQVPEKVPLKAEQRVEYEVVQTPKGMEARKVLLLTEDKKTADKLERTEKAAFTKASIEDADDVGNEGKSGVTILSESEVSPMPLIREYHALLVNEHIESLERLIERQKELEARGRSTSAISRKLEANIDNLKSAVLASGRDWQAKNLTFAIFGEYFDANGCPSLKEEIKDRWKLWLKGILTKSGSLIDLYETMYPPNFYLNLLPKPSFAIAFRFELEKPYISRDEEQVYLIDNPVAKDRFFGMPMVKESAWKGNLRQAMRESLGIFEEGRETVEDGEIISRLFGPMREEEELYQGCLRFYPTFFERLALEVINPHDRATRAGKQPILFEAAPNGVLGDFYLLYTPLDLDEEGLERGKIDLKEVVKGINAMFTKYGFSAKKLDGYGFAKQQIYKIDGTPMFQTNSKEIADLQWDETEGIAYIGSFSTLDDLEALHPSEEE